MRKLGKPDTYRGNDDLWVHIDDNARKVRRYEQWLHDTGRTAYVFPEAHANTLREKARKVLLATVPLDHMVEVSLDEYIGKPEDIGG